MFQHMTSQVSLLHDFKCCPGRWPGRSWLSSDAEDFVPTEFFFSIWKKTSFLLELNLAEEISVLFALEVFFLLMLAYSSIHAWGH